MNSKLKKIVVAVALASCCVAPMTQAAKFINGARLGYGYGSRDNINGPRLALMWDWPTWFNDSLVQLTGFWDFSAAYWHTDGRFNHTFTFGAAPIFRIQLNKQRFDPIVLPYIEGGSGFALHTARHTGSKDKGAVFGFENMLGAGVMFGSKKQFDFSYHFIHYSNASMYPPNEGVDIQMLFSLAYRWK